MAREVQVFDLLAQRRLELALADDHEAGIGDLTHHFGRRFDQIPVAFVRHQGRHVADDRSAARQPKLGLDVESRRRRDMVEVDAVMHRRCPFRRHAVGDEHRPNRIRRAQEHVDLPVFPPGERIAANVKIDAPRYHEAWQRVEPAERTGERHHRNGVRIVRLHHRRAERPQHPRQLPGRPQVHFA